MLWKRRFDATADIIQSIRGMSEIYDNIIRPIRPDKKSSIWCDKIIKIQWNDNFKRIFYNSLGHFEIISVESG